MKHKHYNEIAQWAGGAVIQSRAADTDDAWTDDFEPHWWNSFFEFRVKPKQSVVRWLWAWRDSHGRWFKTAEFLEKPDKETWVKLEWSRQEFPT